MENLGLRVRLTRKVAWSHRPIGKTTVHHDATERKSLGLEIALKFDGFLEFEFIKTCDEEEGRRWTGQKSLHIATSLANAALQMGHLLKKVRQLSNELRSCDTLQSRNDRSSSAA